MLMTKQALSIGQPTSIALFGGVLMTFSGAPAVASPFNPAPLYETTLNYTTTIPTTGSLTGFDFTDIYSPQSSDPSATFPIALMLQGALVDKADYSNFASQISRYGFVVAVPNHLRTFPPLPFPALFPVQELVNDVLGFMKAENLNPLSPIKGKVDVTKMGLLGHSFGGSVGLGAIQGDCFPTLCTTEFTRPEELKAGIFYGARFGDQDPLSPVPPIFNDGIPTGLIGGTFDGVIPLNKVLETYNQIQDPPKVLVSVIGANHYGITNEDNPQRDPMRPTLSQEVATETIARWSALFLRAHVQGDAGAFDYVYNTGDVQDENVMVLSARVPEPSATWGIFILGMGSAVSRLRSQKKHQN
jgi:pimeloyl-ACP methyl ester carboxylesterase